MKETARLLLVLSMLASCTPKAGQVERTMEDGVEVVLNHVEPYSIKSEPTIIKLEEEFTIDTEKDDIAQLGLTDIWGFDVNSEGNIYFFKSPMRGGDFVSVFDKNGYHLTSFAQKGQGPAEIQYPSYQKFNLHNELPIIDAAQRKLVIFNESGEAIKETRLDSELGRVGTLIFPLENGNNVVRRLAVDPSGRSLIIILSLFNSELKEIKEFIRYELQPPGYVDRFRLPIHVSIWGVSKEFIYVGDEERGYEIWAYDFEGNLRRKIRKEHMPVEISDEYKNGVKKPLEKPSLSHLKDKVYFPKHYPPFQFLFTDDDGRLFVMTYEKGENPKEHIFDIFNPDGVFIAKKSMEILLTANILEPGASLDSWVVMKKNRFYCLREKNSGFKELVVYKVKWE